MNGLCILQAAKRVIKSTMLNNTLSVLILTVVCRRIPYTVATRHKHGACAALLNPSSAEPLVWPSPLKFISELNPEAKVLLERALMEANREREKDILKGTAYSLPSPAHSDGSVEDDIDEVVSITPIDFHYFQMEVTNAVCYSTIQLLLIIFFLS